ncbi:unnamed protein product [Brassicogethes aeneus]|uniref:Uncharacterized protein n=1 Tax=Brassicogethes aeneus TaxID=1431903 RepID=A0A9P0FQ09_BRAAE|nr:unnamed protein product [Brassicogethes aeneus]
MLQLIKEICEPPRNVHSSLSSHGYSSQSPQIIYSPSPPHVNRFNIGRKTEHATYTVLMPPNPGPSTVGSASLYQPRSQQQPPSSALPPPLPSENKIVEVNPITNMSEKVVGLIIPRGMEDMTEGILAVAKDRFPDLANNMEGEQILVTCTKMGSIKKTKRIPVARPSAEAMFQGIVELGEIAKSIDAGMLSLAAPAVTAVVARKMAACALVAKLGIQARVCVPKRKFKQAGSTPPTLARQASTRPRKDGHLLVSLSEGNAKEVAKLITESKAGEKVEALTSERNTTLMMTIIEAALSEAEVKAAIVEQTGAAAEDIEVRGLRGGFRGK